MSDIPVPNIDIVDAARAAADRIDWTNEEGVQLYSGGWAYVRELNVLGFTVLLDRGGKLATLNNTQINFDKLSQHQRDVFLEELQSQR